VTFQYTAPEVEEPVTVRDSQTETVTVSINGGGSAREVTYRVIVQNIKD